MYFSQPQPERENRQLGLLVLVHTLALLTQYERDYGFDVVRGRQEYPCVHEEKLAIWKRKYHQEPTAAECHFTQMHECPYSGKCAYLLAKAKALRARKAACTYRYAGVSKFMQQRTGHVVMDEAHDSAEELISFNTHSFRFGYIFEMDLPMFPIHSYGEDNKGAVMTAEAKAEIVSWIDRCLSMLAPRIDETKSGSEAQKTYDQYFRISESLYDCDWFLRTDDKKAELMALSAKHVAQRIFKNKDTKLLMSATIGNPKPLAKILGIEEYHFIESEHPTPAAFRSITDLQVPRMTKRNINTQPNLPFIQAQYIWNWISGFPQEWRGLIVTTSYQKINWLEEHIQYFNKRKRRLIVQNEDMSVSDAIRKFITDVLAGDILIGTIQGLGSGLDLYGDLARWVVVAGVPHANPTDMYEKARREQDGGIDYQYWTTYNAVIQACGRASRGERTDNGNYIANFCALADGSATTKTAYKYFPSWFSKAIVK